MKLLDKLKDLFMDEVDVDDELEIEEEPLVEKKVEAPKKEENVLPKVMRETIEKEKKEIAPEPPVVPKKEEEPKPQEKVREFNFPIDFEMEVPSRNRRNVIPDLVNDIEEPPKKKEVETFKEVVTPTRNINVLDFEKEAQKKVSSLYSDNKELIDEKPKFKATPVISPVYGILDKNYTKEEVKERNEEPTLIAT